MRAERHAGIGRASRKNGVLSRFFALLLLGSGAVRAAEPNQLDASPALFAVLAAINAAGYDADLSSPANHPLRETVRRELAARHVPSLEEIKSFFARHRQKDPSAELSQYVSFALSVDGPPNFKYRFLTYQLPPDVQPLEGFDALMRRLWKEADLEGLWRQAQPAIEQALTRYQQPAAHALLEVNAYLRSSSASVLGRRFQIYVDLLGAPNQIHTRNYANDYYVVLTPSSEPQAGDIRHVYLHYLLDAMVGRYSEQFNKKRALLDYALGSPLLEEHYKSDFLLLVAESLIKAIESRLARNPELVQQALREGFVLAPYFAEALPAYEKQEQAMRFYVSELADGISLKKEEQRLEKVEFASERAVRKAKPAPAPKTDATGPRKILEEAEDHYANGDLEQASRAWRSLLEPTTEKPLHAAAYYGLARIAARQKDPETAEKLFQKALECSPEPLVKAWAHVYLGRLADAAGERQEALRHYQAALAVEGGSAAARAAAEKGLQAALPKPGQQK